MRGRRFVDVSGHLPVDDAAILLAEGGRIATLVPSGPALVSQASGLVRRDRPRVRNLIVVATAERIGRAVSLATSGELRPRPGAVHPLGDVVDVLSRRATGADRTIGKIVFTADDASFGQPEARTMGEIHTFGMWRATSPGAKL